MNQRVVGKGREGHTMSVLPICLAESVVLCNVMIEIRERP